MRSVPWQTSTQRMLQLKPPATVATPDCAYWGDSGRTKAGFWSQTIKLQSSKWFPWGQTLASSHTFCCCCLLSKFSLEDSLWPQGLQHARLSCPLPSPGVCSNPCPLCWWYHSTTSSSITPSCPQSFPASGSFPISQLFASGVRSIGVSAPTSVLPINIQGWFSLGLTGLISLLSKGLTRVFSSTTIWKHQFFSPQPSLWSNSHIHTWLLEKPQLWLDGPLLAK